MNRRQFIVRSSLCSASSLISIGTHGWAARSTAATNPNPQRLIVVFLRGAIDGLSVVVPYREPTYYTDRPRIAIPQPGQTNGALDLDGQFGLHPALAPLLPLWQQKSLAFVHACGSKDETRSHFDAQDYLESGTPGIKSTRDGWMNRLLGVMSDKNPIQAVSVGATTPRILIGKRAVANLAAGRSAGSRMQIDKPQVATAFDRLYGNNDALSRTYREGRVARTELLKDLQAEMQMANNGATLPNGFPSDAQRLARLMARDSRIQVAFLAVGGWDTHINQGASQGYLSRNLERLGKGIVALQEGLGAAYQHTTIVVMSEFGRTVRENGNGGTDHGHGNVMWLLGGGIRGGKVYGKWAGLGSAQLYQGRDLAVTTDFRDVLSTVIARRLRVEESKLQQVFPKYTGQMLDFA
ncbi:DUF1501 domain-containing protein [Chamaesiphon minutus]|uniref:DUF1501 domain-containing protein n=1 Tax=Chamaesiphon minutus (strain ATCC 27169 / PCC 6605) TaxID=1173020 RepID=K9UM27_CHAP6|nr:DUF1501 domain-containing protein [Chamaesiphon minutus]AFY95496.1 hypothetical protein Cha6605_4577 [Chamaesiphon minutus PCC 6605]